MNADLGELRQVLSGELHLPGDVGWGEGRTIFSSMIDRRPAAIARVADADDIVTCLAWAGRTGTQVAIRAGGHSVAGLSLNDGGLVLDVRSLDSIHVDP